MHKTAIVYAVGKLMQITGGLLLIPLAISVYDHRQLSIAAILSVPEVYGGIIGASLSFVLGTLAVYHFREGKSYQGVREGLAIVTIGWIVLTFFSCMPMFFWLLTGQDGGPQYSVFRAFTDAYFEIMSGFTTTGATILSDIERAPDAIHFLRAMTHWLGGMGIITLAIVVFPGLGVGAYQMFKSEVPGPSKDKLTPRLSQTTSILWGVYGLFTLIETILLVIGGMTPFDAVCHSFATMATGGFSTEGASIAAYQSHFIQWVIIVFMYLAGVNFLLHFRALRGDYWTMLRDREFVFYNLVIGVAIVVITGVLYFQGLPSVESAADSFRHVDTSAEDFTRHYVEQAGRYDSLYDTFRIAAFQTLSIVTTTGFSTVDFDLWPDVLRFILIFLMFFGGCAGSTGGGMKMIRVLVAFKVVMTTIRKRSQPRLVAPVRVGEQVIPDTMVLDIVSFFVLFTGLFILVALLMTLFVPDLTTAVSASIATIGNVGPGLAGVGAIEHYGWIPIPGKWVLIVSMLLGRLEIFTVLVCLRPAVWRK
jgi:trk system potassium uptake protein TrkH